MPVGKVYTDEEKTEANAKTITLGRYSFDNSTGEETLIQGQTGTTYTATTSASVIESAYYEFADDTESQNIVRKTYNNTKAKNLAGFVESVLSNGGFYIGRFEAGKEDDSQTAVDGSEKPSIKAGLSVWNSINQPEAAVVCQNMYNTNNDKITSDLINSYAWDTTLSYIQKCGTNSIYSTQKSIQGSLARTGAATNGTNNDKQCNIYDLAGNVYELTTETCTNLDGNYKPRPCVHRGGYWVESDNRFRALSRLNTYVSRTSYLEYQGFRPILYF